MIPDKAGSDRAAGHRPFTLVNPDGPAAIVIFCDHASNVVPPELRHLGLCEAERQRHIAWDIGAAEIAVLLARRFDAPAVLCGTSRLVIDCNRYPEDPNAMPLVSDGTGIPGNAELSPSRRAERVARYFDPYHAAVERIIEGKLAAGFSPIVLSIHSMTPQMGGARFRSWQIALSSDRDRRLADPMLAALRRRKDVTVGDNEPYNLDPREDYSTPVHAIRRGLLHLQVEFRQDEVGTSAGVQHWARLFGDALAETITAEPLVLAGGRGS
jgi:predicted N-formylglutamate amidohydrolase